MPRKTRRVSNSVRRSKVVKEPCDRKFGRMFKNIDIYGEQISLTYKGENAYKTKLGAVVTMFLVLILVTYGTYRFYVLSNRINPDVSKKAKYIDLDKAGLFQPQNTGFDFAFGVRGGMDESYGKFKVRQIIY